MVPWTDGKFLLSDDLWRKIFFCFAFERFFMIFFRCWDGFEFVSCAISSTLEALSSLHAYHKAPSSRNTVYSLTPLERYFQAAFCDDVLRHYLKPSPLINFCVQSFVQTLFSIFSMFVSLRHMLPIRQLNIKSLTSTRTTIPVPCEQKDLFSLIDRLSWWWNVDQTINQVDHLPWDFKKGRKKIICAKNKIDNEMKIKSWKLRKGENRNFEWQEHEKFSNKLLKI